ncbi:MAG: hypothetical protein JNJ83_04825 [Verrucomicrobiaceae bacterium]|nr:hypothetical protein [Verrucomicrobiaceae bacterium]
MNDFNPASYVLWGVAILLVLFIGRFVMRRVAMMDKVLRQCPNCGGDETYGIRKAKNSTVYDYNCRLCEHQWTWDQTTPYPPVTVRPELIAAGKAKLAEQQRDRHGSHGGPGNFG